MVVCDPVYAMTLKENTQAMAVGLWKQLKTAPYIGHCCKSSKAAFEADRRGALP